MSNNFLIFYVKQSNTVYVAVNMGNFALSDYYILMPGVLTIHSL